MIDKRLMYAQGQRVGGIRGNNAGSMLVTPTRDGSRPGYYGPDAGHENDPGHGSNAPGGGDGDSGRNMANVAGPVTSSFTDADDNRDNYKTDQYTTGPTTTQNDTGECNENSTSGCTADKCCENFELFSNNKTPTWIFILLAIIIIFMIDRFLF